MLSDIHFDPLYMCTSSKDSNCQYTLNQLIEQDVSEWDQIFNQNPAPLFDYSSDTNYFLLESYFNQVSKMHGNEPFTKVLFAGDMLAHHLDTNFLTMAPKKYRTQIFYEKFIDKLYQYIGLKMLNAFGKPNNLTILPAIGNNDSYHGDYVFDPDFYHTTLAIWFTMGLIDSNLYSQISQTYDIGGYFNAPISSELEIIVINSNLYSINYSSDDPAIQQAQLDWLQNKLEALHSQKKKVWVMQHIPVGVDAFSSIPKNPPKDPWPVMLWASDWQDKYIKTLKPFVENGTIQTVIAGHSHRDSFNVINYTDNGSIQSPEIIMPALSTVYGTNPAVTVLDYEPKSGSLYKKVYYQPNSSAEAMTQWQVEYDSEAKPIYPEGFPKSLLSTKAITTLESELPINVLFQSQFYEKYIVQSQAPNAQIMPEQRVYYTCAIINNISANTYTKCLPEQQK